MHNPKHAAARQSLPAHPAWRERCQRAIGQSLLEHRPVVITTRLGVGARAWMWFAVSVTEDPRGQFPPVILTEHGRERTHFGARRAGSRALTGRVGSYGGLWYARAGAFFTFTALAAVICALVTFVMAVRAAFDSSADAERDALAFAISVITAVVSIAADERLRSDGVW